VRKNVLRELIKAGKPSLGTHFACPWPTIIEIIGHSGVFDYVEFQAEYAPYDLFTLENMGRAIDTFEHLSGMIKIEQEPRTYIAAKALNSGFQNVLFADIRTVEDAREAVRAARAETPGVGGRRGVAAGRDVGVVLEGGSPAFVQATQDTVVAIMIEKKEAVENLESILDVPGIDMVNFGPSDYSMSIGVPGQRNHPAVLEAEKYVIETALRKGVIPRVETGGPDEMKRYIDMGVRHFCNGGDVWTLFRWCKESGGAMRRVLESL